MEYIKLILILSVIAFLAFYFKKKIQQKQFNQVSQNSIIQVVDGVQVALGNNLYLTKVGEEYILVAMGSNGVDMIKLDQKELNDPKEKFDQMFGNENPNIALQTMTKTMKERLWKK